MSNYTTFNYPASGLNNTAEYIASGLPWTSSSVQTTTVYSASFPFVTNEITVGNANAAAGDSLRVGFTLSGTNGTNYFLIPANQQVTFNVRVKTIYLRANSTTVSSSIYAGLTQIPAKSMPVLTGSATFNPAVTASVYGYSTGLG